MLTPSCPGAAGAMTIRLRGLACSPPVAKRAYHRPGCDETKVPGRRRRVQNRFMCPALSIAALEEDRLTHQIVLRDVARIVLPFSLFVGFFSHGTVSAAGFGACVLCAGYEVWNGLRRASTARGFESA